MRRFTRAVVRRPPAKRARPPPSSTARASRARKRGGLHPRGYDAGKKIKGKKRHVLVDTQGLLMHAIVHSADIQDRDGGALLMASLFGAFPFLVRLYADRGYQGPEFQGAMKRILARVDLEIVKRLGHAKASSFCPSAGSSNAPSPGLAAAADSPRIGNASTARRSPSCASPPSASCCESYAILHDVSGQTLSL
jgi:hypothetical protein